MWNLLLFMVPPFSSEAVATFLEGLRVTGLGMGTVIGVLFIFMLIVKALIKLFPEKE